VTFGAPEARRTKAARENPEECERLRPDGYSGFFRVRAPVEVFAGREETLSVFLLGKLSTSYTVGSCSVSQEVLRRHVDAIRSVP
jgi:hypothetical protein